MRKKSSPMSKLIGDAAFVAAIALANRCLEKYASRPLVKRDMDGAELNRRLSIVNLVYHAIGIFYNE